MSRFLALAATELRLLMRNRTAAVTAVIMPSLLSCFWLFAFHAHTTRQWAGVIAVQLGVVLAFGVYVTATNTMVARRHGLVLKRLRTSGISQPALLLGTIAPALVCGAGQLVILAVVDAIAGAPAPADPLSLAVAALLGLALCTAAAIATTVLTPSPERAQITTMPLAFVLLGGAIALTQINSEALRQSLVAIPGTAIAQLSRLAFAGGAMGSSVGGLPAGLPALAALIAWTAVFAALARNRFRWDQRA